MKTGFTYILSSQSRRLYVGVTSNLVNRIYQHKTGENSADFTKKYKINRLVYFEETELITDAIAREKQIKKWRREKKIALIESKNPEWRDLSNDWIEDRDVFFKKV